MGLTIGARQKKRELLDQIAELEKQVDQKPEPTSPKITQLQKEADEIGDRYTDVTNKMVAVTRELDAKKAGLGDAIYFGADAGKLADEIAKLERTAAALQEGVLSGRSRHVYALDALKEEKELERARMAKAESEQAEKERAEKMRAHTRAHRGLVTPW